MTPRSLIIALLISIAIALGIGAFQATVAPSAARCAWCPEFPCYGAGTCGTGCACMKRGMDIQGVCVSLE